MIGISGGDYELSVSGINGAMCGHTIPPSTHFKIAHVENKATGRGRPACFDFVVCFLNCCHIIGKQSCTMLDNHVHKM